MTERFRTFYDDYDKGTWFVGMVDMSDTGAVYLVGEPIIAGLDARRAEAVAAALNAASHPETLTYDENAAAILDALPSFLDDVRAFMDAPERRRSPGSASHRRERLTVSLVWMGKRVEAMTKQPTDEEGQKRLIREWNDSMAELLAADKEETP